MQRTRINSVDNHLEQICYDTIENMVKVLQGENDVEQNNKIPCQIVKKMFYRFLKITEE